jgi:hypothetical protein
MRLLFICFCVLLPGCLLVPYPHDAYMHSTVTGRVRDAETKQPVSGVPVSLAGDTTFSGADGGFSFKAEKQRKWLVVIPLLPFDPLFQCSDRLEINSASAGQTPNEAYRGMSVDVRSCRYSAVAGWNEYLKDASLIDDVGTINLVEDRSATKAP